jgi:hypothetical protein
MAEIYYAKNVEAFYGDTKLPTTTEELLKNYGKVCTINETNEDKIFSLLNYNPRKFIEYPLPSGVTHTSMSVGDIVKRGNKVSICRMVGWEKSELKEEK